MPDVDLSGFDTFFAELERVVDEGLKEIAEDLLGESQRRAPIDTGALRASAVAEVVNDEEGGRAAQVAFNTPYAATQHENIEYNHPRGGEDHFLSKPLLENALRYEAHMAAKIEKATNG